MLSRDEILHLDRRHVWRPYTSAEDHTERDPFVVVGAEGRLPRGRGWAALHRREQLVVGDEPRSPPPASGRAAQGTGRSTLSLRHGDHDQSGGRAARGGAGSGGARGPRSRLLQRRRLHLGRGRAEDGVPILAPERSSRAGALRLAGRRLSWRHRGCDERRRPRGVRRRVPTALLRGLPRAAPRRRGRLGSRHRRHREAPRREKRRDRGRGGRADPPGSRGDACVGAGAPLAPSRGHTEGGHVPHRRRGLHRLRAHGDDVGLRSRRHAPDLLCVAKGFSGGVLPFAATLATPRIFDGFRGGARGAL